MVAIEGGELCAGGGVRGEEGQIDVLIKFNFGRCKC